MRIPRYLLLAVSLLLSVPVNAISPDAEAFCRKQAQQAMFMGEFEAKMSYSRCTQAMQQRELDQMNAENCAQLGVGCSPRQDSSSGSSGRSNSYGCQQDCQERRHGCMVPCRAFGGSGCSEQCNAEYQSCLAGCR